jgi:hypothetical protein
MNAADGEATGGGDCETEALDLAETLARLKACAARLAKKHSFAPGHLVRWKKGLKNKKTPAYGEPVIVMQVLEQPVFDPDANDSGGPYFREPMDLVAGEIVDDGSFLCYHYDARRLEPYDGPVGAVHER